MPERWLPIDSWDGLYEVSEYGKVRSLSRRVPAKNGKTRAVNGRVLSPVLRAGYWTVSLKDGSRKSICGIHRLMLMAFSPCEGMSDLDVCHNNGIRTDNSLPNLRWDTRAGNLRDMDLHGTRIRGSSHPNSKLTESQAREILASTKSNRYLAAAFGVSEQLIYRVRARTSWSHL